MKIYEHIVSGEAVRSYRKDAASAGLAFRASLLAPTNLFLSDIAANLNLDMKGPAAYQAVQRAFPIERKGLVYRIERDPRAQRYSKSKQVAVSPGRLEDFPPAARPKPKGAALDELVRVEVARQLGEIEKFVNVFAMREECCKLIDGVEDRLSKKISEIVARAIDAARVM